MNRNFIQACIKNLIIQSDFMPVRDEEGHLRMEGPASLLTKSAYGSFVMVELLDGDALTAEALESKLLASEDMLEKMDFGSAQQVFEVIFFETHPETEKLEVIADCQSHQQKGRKQMKCLTVNLNTKEMIKNYKRTLSDMGLEKTIRRTLEQGMEQEGEFLDLEALVSQKEQEYRIEYSAKRPVLTYALIALNILVALAIYLYSRKSGTSYDELLNDFGAKDNARILSGELWRLVTPMVLHGGIMHLLLNCYSLYVIGMMVERLFGHFKFFWVYLIAGIFGSIASLAFSTQGSVGASGAIFGLMGTLLYFGLQKPALFRAYFGYNVIVNIVIMLVYGFSNPGIDNFAHLGGLIGGFLATGAVSVPLRGKWYLNRYLYLVLTLVIASAGLSYGLTNRQNTLQVKVNQMIQLYQEQKWPEVEKTAEEILAQNIKDKSTKATVLGSLARAEALSGKPEESMVHARELVVADPADGHYLLGILYYDMKQYEASKSELLEAKKYNPGSKNLDQLLEEIDAILKRSR